ncbi:hypothetical protein OFM39_31200, partial [Escherichia coli]|nr:hypothetical protein [Escherichia coli]
LITIVVITFVFVSDTRGLNKRVRSEFFRGYPFGLRSVPTDVEVELDGVLEIRVLRRRRAVFELEGSELGLNVVDRRRRFGSAPGES